MKKWLFKVLFSVCYGREYARLMRAMTQAKWTATVQRSDLERMEYLTRLRVLIFQGGAGGGI